MPIIKSAKKRVRVTRKATSRNMRTKRVVRSALKTFAAKPTSSSVSEAQKALDIAVKKGIIHKNKAARQKSRLAATAKVAGVKPVKKATPAKITTTKKKTPTKQTAAKAKTTKKK